MLSYVSEDWIIGNLWPGYMRLGSSGSQGKVQSEMMYVVSAHERMSVSMTGSRWSEILLWLVFLRVYQCSSFEAVGSLRASFDY